MLGATVGTVMLSRVAAADMYPPERRARDIALVLFGAVFGALLEPERISTLLAQRSGEGTIHSPEPPERAAPLNQILRRPGVVVVLVAFVVSFSVMASMMTLVGYVLVGHGHHQGAVYPVISAHFIGTFGLVFVVGDAIDRVGRLRALLGGLLLLGFSTTLSVVRAVGSLLATSLALFGIGLGWTFTYVAATAELTDKTVAVERGKILGFGDLLVGLLNAVLATLGGLALSTIGLLGLA